MSITTLFRVILISGLVTSIVGIIAGFSLSETLPPILQEYLLQAEKKEVSNFEMVFLLVASLALLVLRSGPQFSDMTLSGRSVLIVPNNTGTDYD